MSVTRSRTWSQNFAVGDGTEAGLGVALARAKDYADQDHPGTRDSMMTPVVRRSGVLPDGSRTWIVTVIGRVA